MTSPALLPDNADPLLRGSVAACLVTDVPRCEPEATVAELRTMLVGRAYESTVDVAVCSTDDGVEYRLLGLIPLEQALAAEPTRLARDLMDTDPLVVGHELHQEEAAWKAAHHGISTPSG